MKIAINARVLNERQGGPARVTLNLIKELSKIDDKNKYSLLLYDNFKFNFELKVILPKIVNILLRSKNASSGYGSKNASSGDRSNNVSSGDDSQCFIWR